MAEEKNIGPFTVGKKYSIVGYIGGPPGTVQEGICKVYEIKGAWIRVASVIGDTEADERWLNVSALHYSGTAIS